MTIWVKLAIALAAVSLVLALGLKDSAFLITALLLALLAVILYLRHRWDLKNGNISS